MPFVAARCPQCGGEIQLDNQKDTGFCMHCGSKIVVQEALRAVRIDNSHMVETWIKLGKAALEVNNYSEAYEYFTRVLEVKPDDWFATLYKGYSAGLLSTWKKPRINELIYAIQKANNLIEQSSLSEEDKISAKNYLPPTLIEAYKQYFSLVFEALQEIVFNRYDIDRMTEFRQVFEKSIDHYQTVLTIIRDYEDQASKNNQLNIKIEILGSCRQVCNPYFFYDDLEKIESYRWGYTAEEKRQYIKLYDDIMVEVCYEKPGFDDDLWIDRLSPPPDVAPKYEIETNCSYELNMAITRGNKMRAYSKIVIDNIDQVLEAEEEAKKLRKKQLEKYKQQIFFKEHPEEYQKYLEQESKKKLQREEKVKEMLFQKGTLAARVDEIENEISKLQLDRRKLGLFDGKAKRLIDDRIILLQDNQSTEKTEIEKIDKAIESIRKKN